MKWLVNIFKKMWSRIAKAFDKFIKIAAPIGFKLLTTRLSSFAMDVVRNLEGVDMSNNDKRVRAFEDIKNRATAEGIYFESNWINILIGLALSAVREIAKDNS